MKPLFKETAIPEMVKREEDAIKAAKVYSTNLMSKIANREDMLFLDSVLENTHHMLDGLFTNGQELMNRYRHETEHCPGKRQIARILSMTRDMKHLSDNDRQVCDKLIGDHQILSKIILVDEIGDRNNCIVFGENMGKEEDVILFLDEYLPHTKDEAGNYIYEYTDPISVLNHMKHNYEAIFIYMYPSLWFRVLMDKWSEFCS